MKKTDDKLNKNLSIIATGSIFFFLGIFLSKAFAYLYRILIARNLGPEEYGIFTLALVVFGWATTFAVFGINQGVVRFVSYYSGKNQPNKVKRLHSIALTRIISYSLIVMIIMFLIAPWISSFVFKQPNLEIYIKTFSFLVPFSALGGMYLSFILAKEKAKAYSFIYNILQNGLKLILLIILIYFGLKRDAIIISFIIGSASVLIASFYYTKKNFPEIFPIKFGSKPEDSEIKNPLLSYSWPMLLYGISSSLLLWIDTVLVGYYLGTLEVGYYNAAVPLALLIGFIPALFLQLFLPIITKEYSKKNYQVVKELSKQISKWVFIFSIPLTIIMMLFPGVFINIFFGSEFLLAENVLRILAIGYFIFSLSEVSSNMMSMLGKSRFILYAFSFVAIIDLLLNIWLIPRYGIDGAALSTVISYLVLFAIFLFGIKKYVGFYPLRRKSFNIAVSALIPSIFIWWISETYTSNYFIMATSLILYSVIYLILLFVTRSLDKNDLSILNKIKGKISRLGGII